MKNNFQQIYDQNDNCFRAILTFDYLSWRDTQNNFWHVFKSWTFSTTHMQGMCKFPFNFTASTVVVHHETTEIDTDRVVEVSKSIHHLEIGTKLWNHQPNIQKRCQKNGCETISKPGDEKEEGELGQEAGTNG